MVRGQSIACLLLPHLSQSQIDTTPNTTFKRVSVAQYGTSNALIYTAGIKTKSTYQLYNQQIQAE